MSSDGEFETIDRERVHTYNESLIIDNINRNIESIKDDINNKDIQELFYYAIMLNYVSVLKLLMSLGYNINNIGHLYGYDNIQIAVLIGNLKVTKLLLDNGANTNCNIDDYLIDELMSGHYSDDNMDDIYEYYKIDKKCVPKRFDVLTIALLNNSGMSDVLDSHLFNIGLKLRYLEDITLKEYDYWFYYHDNTHFNEYINSNESIIMVKLILESMLYA